MIRKKIKSFLVFGFVILMLVVYWSYFVIQKPITIWGISEDAPIMSLAEAINIDHWLLVSDGHRALSQAQYYQPGIPYQFLSWFVYRLTSPTWNASFLEQFRNVQINPHNFWMGIQFITVLLTFFALLLIWRKLKNEDLTTLLAALTVYFVSTQAMHYGVFIFFNESFTLLFAVIFFIFGQKILSSELKITFKHIFLCGVFTGLLYLHKMNYVVWGLAFLPALLVRTYLREEKFKIFLKQAIFFIVIVCLSVVVFGRLLLSAEGLKLMLESHKAIFAHSETYGNGSNTIVSLKTMLNNIIYFKNTDSNALFALVLFTILPIIFIVKEIKNKIWLKQHLTNAVFLMAAMLVMTLALIKHFQPHYTVSVAALFPLWIIWLSKAGGKKVIPLLLPVILFIVFVQGKSKMDSWLNYVATSEKTLLDEKKVLMMPLDVSEKRLWMYRVTTPSFQRLFSVNFAGLESLLLPELDKIQGEHIMASPWHFYLGTYLGLKKMDTINWRYMIVPKAYMIDKTILWEYHPWINDPQVIKIELDELVVFEKTKLEKNN
jgi:hypothetical protein